jgi:ligand-binding sensor domain-containing protein/signal transduction histidine kinase
LRTSNTFREARIPRSRCSRSLTAAIVLACLASPLWAVDPNRTVSQYIRERWGTDSGFPGGSVSSIAQTSDGYLWIGTEKGLIRFDGLNFRLFQQAIPNSLPIGPVQALMADWEGNLWVLLQSTKILRYHDGKFDLGREEAEFGITSVSRQEDGTVLFSSLAMGTLAYHAGKFQVLTASSEPAPPTETATAEDDDRATRMSWAAGLVPHRFAEPNSAVSSMAETSDGRVWLGTRDKGLFYLQQGRVFPAGEKLRSQKINCLLAMEGRELWIGTEAGVLRWNGTEITSAGVPSSLLHAQIFSVIRDRDSNIWVGTSGALVRMNAQGVVFDGASSSAHPTIKVLFEDREGDLWIGTSQGIERLRDSAFVTYSAADGLPSESNGPIYIDREGRAWFAPLEGGLHWLKGEHLGSITDDGLAHDVIYSISGGEDELWVGRRQGGLTHLQFSSNSVATNTYTKSDGLAQNSVYAVHQARDRSVWAGTLSGGVSELRNGRFTNYTSANGLSSNTVTSIAEAPDGTMWFATPNGLDALSKGQWRAFSVSDGLPSANLNCLLVDSAGILWIGSSSGLAFLSSGHIEIPRDAPEPLREQIFGIAEDKNGGLWIATSNHVLRVKRADLLAGSANPGLRDYGLADGLLGLEGVKRYQSVVADALGRIWFSMNRGISVVEPNRSTGSSAPALVRFEVVSADGAPIGTQAPASIPSARQRVSFTYVGLSLANPERVRYRYRLDGFDRNWSDPTAARTAVYTNLSPGSYRFRVIATNSDGLWNGAESSLSFTVEPSWWQTWWFRLLIVLVAGLITLTAYRLRLRQFTRQLNVRFEERLAERTRIAQDLHDTLLQGFLSAAMQLDVANDRIEESSPAKPIVTRVLKLVGPVIEDGRRTVRGLRSSDGGRSNLEDAFSRIPQELAVPPGIDFHVIVEGQVQPVHPFIRDEVYRIGREALANAFRHSQGKNVEVEVDFSVHQLKVLVRDDGCGIDPQVLRSGREGHWGLSGMRERAGRIGAKIKVWSRDAGGTEVELIVPSSVAFRLQSSGRVLQWFSRQWRRVERVART